MPLVRVRVSATGEKDVYVAGEAISHLATIMIGTGSPRQVVKATSAGILKQAGVAIGTVVSGALVYAVTKGFVSGLICALAVQMGDRIVAANKTSGPGLASGPGLVIPATPTISGWIPSISGFLDFTSGAMAAGQIGIDGTALSRASGLLSGVTGFRVVSQPVFSSGEVVPVLGKALTSGGVGSGIQAVLLLSA